jgi:hypothetical protein
MIAPSTGSVNMHPRSRRAILVTFAVVSVLTGALQWFGAAVFLSESGLAMLFSAQLVSHDWRNMGGAEVRASGWPRKPINDQIRWTAPDEGQEEILGLLGVSMTRGVSMHSFPLRGAGSQADAPQQQSTFAQAVYRTGWPIPVLESYFEHTPTSYYDSRRVLWGNMLFTALVAGFLVAGMMVARYELLARRDSRLGKCHRCGYQRMGLARCPECGDNVK